MEDLHFDDLARRLAARGTRRGLVTGLLGTAAGLWTLTAAHAEEACPAGWVYRRRIGCVCELTGRPPDAAGCPCRRGQTRCGETCVELATDPDHCGACGAICPSGPRATSVVCQDSVCRIAGCEPGWGDCDGDPATGCETDLTAEDNCGAGDGGGGGSYAAVAGAAFTTGGCTGNGSITITYTPDLT